MRMKLMLTNGRCFARHLSSVRAVAKVETGYGLDSTFGRQWRAKSREGLGRSQRQDTSGAVSISATKSMISRPMACSFGRQGAGRPII